MFKAIKRNLVQSYVGAVGLGSLLAQCVTHFVNIFVMPIASFVSHREWDSVVQHSGHDGFSRRGGHPRGRASAVRRRCDRRAGRGWLQRGAWRQNPPQRGSSTYTSFTLVAPTIALLHHPACGTMTSGTLLAPTSCWFFDNDISIAKVVPGTKALSHHVRFQQSKEGSARRSKSSR